MKLTTETTGGVHVVVISGTVDSHAAGSIRRGRRRLLTAFGDFFRCQRDYRKLRSMPDNLLDDLGLTRADLRAARPRLF